MAQNRTNRNMIYGKRSVPLSIIAMIELLLLSISLTFSWFEPPVNPALYGDDIYTYPVLLSTVNMTVDGVADLNKHFDYRAMIEDDDLKDSLPDINKTKFSPVESSDGLYFTSPNGLVLNSSEIHATALSFQFTINSAIACDFWFKSLPVIVVGETRGVLQEPSFENDPSEDQFDSEDTSEPASDEPTSEEATEESTITETTETEEVATDTTEENTEETNTDTTTETDTFVEETQEEYTESVESTEVEEENPATRGQSSYYDVFYISFHGEDCMCDGVLRSPCVAIPLSEASSYLVNNVDNMKLFSHVPGENGDNATVITCSIWYQPTESNHLPYGTDVAINVQIASNYGQTRTIHLTDETTTLNELYPLMGADGYYVELVDTATGAVYPAVYDIESGIWCAEIPVTVEEFDVLYRSKGIEREIIATWESIDGREVHSFALMDEGVFISSEN